MPTLGKPATSFECNFNTENVEAFIVLTDWIQTQSILNFGQVSALTATLFCGQVSALTATLVCGQVSALTATLVSKYEYTDHSATAAQFHTHQALQDAMIQSGSSKKIRIYELFAGPTCPHIAYFCCTVPRGLSILVCLLATLYLSPIWVHMCFCGPNQHFV
jgi:hypothetical protein